MADEQLSQKLRGIEERLDFLANSIQHFNAALEKIFEKLDKKK